MTHRPHRALVAATLGSLAALAVAGCSDSDGSGSGSSQKSSVQLEVTDAPVDDLAAVTVQFTGVVFNPASDDDAQDSPEDDDNGAPATPGNGAGNGHGDNANADEEADEDNDSGSDFIRFTLDEPRQIDLLALTGGRTEILIDEEIPAGRYEWIRLEVQAERGQLDSFVTQNDGGEVSLFIPSGSQRGLQLNGPFEIGANQGVRYAVDFDLRKSIKDPQGFPDYLMRPTLRIVEVSEAGSIAGTVDSSLLSEEACSADPATGDGAAVYVFTDTTAAPDDLGSANPPLSTARVTLDNDTGMFTYTAAFLEPDSYRVAFTCQAAADEPDADDDIVFSAPQDVSVEAGSSASADFSATAEDDGDSAMNGDDTSGS